MSPEPIKILVVDDDPALLAVLEAGLRMHKDYDVSAVALATEAQDLIRENTYDLIITDYALDNPEINGLSLLRLAREKCPATLVVLITAFASLEITLESIHLGVYDFLTKPFQLDELQLVIRNAADRIQLVRENESLRRQVTQMLDELQEVDRQHTELLDRIRSMDVDGSGSDHPYGTGGHLGGYGSVTSTADLRRRRMQEQLSHYVRMGETIRERLTRERQKIESLFKNGLLPESAYRRAIMDRGNEAAKKDRIQPTVVT